MPGALIHLGGTFVVPVCSQPVGIESTFGLQLVELGADVVSHFHLAEFVSHGLTRLQLGPIAHDLRLGKLLCFGRVLEYLAACYRSLHRGACAPGADAGCIVGLHVCVLGSSHVTQHSGGIRIFGEGI